MHIIEENLLKLTNLSKNIKSKLQSFTAQQILVIENIINTSYHHAVLDGVILNSQLLQLFNKINAKNNVNVIDGNIVFPTINLISNADYFAKIYTSYLDKIVSYLHKNIKNEKQWNDLFVLINHSSIVNLISVQSQFVEQNDINIAQQAELLIKRSVLQNIVLSDLNRIDFVQGEEKTLDAIKAKLATGNKHEQTQSSDMAILVDVEDIKKIITTNKKVHLNNNNQSSALN